MFSMTLRVRGQNCVRFQRFFSSRFDLLFLHNVECPSWFASHWWCRWPCYPWLFLLQQVFCCSDAAIMNFRFDTLFHQQSAKSEIPGRGRQSSWSIRFMWSLGASLLAFRALIAFLRWAFARFSKLDYSDGFPLVWDTRPRFCPSVYSLQSLRIISNFEVWFDSRLLIRWSPVRGTCWKFWC